MWQLSIYRCDWKCGNACLCKGSFALHKHLQFQVRANRPMSSGLIPLFTITHPIPTGRDIYNKTFFWTQSTRLQLRSCQVSPMSQINQMEKNQKRNKTHHQPNPPQNWNGTCRSPDACWKTIYQISIRTSRCNLGFQQQLSNVKTLVTCQLVTSVGWFPTPPATGANKTPGLPKAAHSFGQRQGWRNIGQVQLVAYLVSCVFCWFICIYPQAGTSKDSFGWQKFRHQGFVGLVCSKGTKVKMKLSFNKEGTL